MDGAERRHLLGFESVSAAIAVIVVGMDQVTWQLLVGGSLTLTGVSVVEVLPSGKGIVNEIEAEVGTGDTRRDAAKEEA